MKYFIRPQRHTNEPVFTNIVQLPPEDSGTTHSIIRLANCHIGSKITRRTPVLIMNTKNRKTTIRYAMGNGGSISGLTKHAIAIDYDGLVELGLSANVRSKQQTNIIVRKAGFFESMAWLLNSQDLNIRLGMRFAVLGAALGLISLVITLISLI